VLDCPIALADLLDWSRNFRSDVLAACRTRSWCVCADNGVTRRCGDWRTRYGYPWGMDAISASIPQSRGARARRATALGGHQGDRLRQRFSIGRVCIVADRQQERRLRGEGGVACRAALHRLPQSRGGQEGCRRPRRDSRRAGTATQEGRQGAGRQWRLSSLPGDHWPERLRHRSRQGRGGRQVRRHLRAAQQHRPRSARCHALLQAVDHGGTGVPHGEVPEWLLPRKAAAADLRWVRLRQASRLSKVSGRCHHFGVCWKYRKSGGGWFLRTGISMSSPLKK
jgi:hypothetical protein